MSNGGPSSTHLDLNYSTDDTVTSITNPILSATALYSASSDTIHSAVKALAGSGAFGTTVDDWLGTIDKVVGGLDSLAKSQPFPFVGGEQLFTLRRIRERYLTYCGLVTVAVLLLKGVIKLETQRRENSKRTRALVLQLADMMGALLQLHFVKDPELKSATGESIAGRIQVLMAAIEKDITDCGNLIDAYHKHSLTSEYHQSVAFDQVFSPARWICVGKFFFSGSYAEKFKSRAEGLVVRLVSLDGSFAPLTLLLIRIVNPK